MATRPLIRARSFSEQIGQKMFRLSNNYSGHVDKFNESDVIRYFGEDIKLCFDLHFCPLIIFGRLVLSRTTVSIVPIGGQRSCIIYTQFSKKKINV